MDAIVTQMIILFVLVIVGYVLNKKNLMDEEFDRTLSRLIINVACPCLILSSVMGDTMPDKKLILPLLIVGFITYAVLIGMAILLFILTLTASPYVSMLALTGTVTLCSALESGKMKKWCIAVLPVMVFLALLPYIIKWAAGLTDSPEEITDKIRPAYFFAAAAVAGIFFYAYRAYRERSLFKLGAVASFIAGILFIMSVDFLFHEVLQDHQRKNQSGNS